jgi:nucleotide-binding universal stress UspA family protein
MIKDVTVYLDGSKADDARLAHAAAIASRFEAHLTGLFLNALPDYAIGGYDGALTAEYIAGMEEDAIKAGNDAEPRLAERLAKAAGLSELRRRDLHRDRFWDAVAEQGRVSDLLVMTRPYGETAPLDPLIVEAALFGAGRGVLVVPPETGRTAPPRKVLVGWRNTRETARAVAEAMPFLTAAEQVILAMVDEDGAPAQQGLEPAADIARHLDRHGVATEVRHVSKWDRTADALVNEAKVTGADMIVVGAYGHSRLREWVLGGTTRDLLGTCPLPVLMAH